MELSGTSGCRFFLKPWRPAMLRKFTLLFIIGVLIFAAYANATITVVLPIVVPA